MKKSIFLLSFLFFCVTTYVLNAQTISVTSVGSSPMFCGGDSFGVSFSITGTFTTGNFFTAELSDAAGSFVSPTDIGTLISTNAGTIGVTMPIGTPAGTNYRIRIRSSNPAVYSINTSVAITVTSPGGDPSVFGNGQWNVYAYTGNIITNTSLVYKGTYTEPSLNFDSRNRWAAGSTPSTASGYMGCPVPVDNHSVSYKRTNFACGYYRFDVVGLVNPNGHDDAYQLLVDGVVVASNNGCCAPRPDVYRGILGPSSTVEFRWAENTGSSYGALQITQLPDEDMVVSPIPSICASSSVNLSVVPNINNANYSYLWTAPDATTGTSPTFTTPVGLSGVYTLQVTHLPSGCVRTANINVPPSLAPTITITPNPVPTICPGESVTLTASGANTYQWFNAPVGGTLISSTASVTVAPTVTTTYRVEGSDGCTTSSQTVTVNVVANPADPGTFGNGEWFVACYQGNNFDRYLGYYTEPLLTFDSRNRWGAGGSPSDASGYTGTCTVPVDNHSVIYRRTNFTCGYYQIDVTNHDNQAYLYINGVKVWEHLGCCDSHNDVWRGFLGASSTVEFRWREGTGNSHGGLRFTDLTATQPLITSPAAVTICQGTSTNITANNLPIYSYSSVLNGAHDVFETNATVTYTQITGNPGDFTITPSGSSATVTANVTPTPNPATIRATFTDPVTSCSIIRDIQITVDPLPSTAAVASPATICIGETATLTASGANTYQWYDAPVGGTLIGTGASLVVSPTTTTTYRVEGNNNCATINATVTVTVIPKGTPPLTGTEFGNGEWIAHCYNGRLISAPATTEYRGYYTEKSLTFNSTTRWSSVQNPTLALALGDGSAAYSGCTVNNDNHSISWRRTNFDCGLYTISIWRDDSYRLYVNGVLVASGGCCGYVPNVWSGLLDASSTVELVTQDTGGGSYGGIGMGYSLGSATTSIWTGAVNNDWNNPGNWCPALPTDVTDAIIPGGGVTNFPIVNAAGAECRNLQIAVGATLTINAGFSLAVHGDYIQQGTLVAASNSTVQILHNSTPTNVNISVMGIGSFSNLLIDKPGNVVNLQTPISVNDVLTLNNGELNLNNQTLSINNNSPAAIVRNSSAFIRSETNSATNNSRICWNMGSTTGAFVFPFGVSFTEYIPVTFNKQTNANTTICLSTRATLTTDNTPWATGVSNMVGVSGATAENDVVDRWWDISSTLNPLPAPGADVTFRYRGVENTIAAPQTDNLAVQHWDGSNWEVPYPSSSPGVTSGIGSVTATGLLNFSPFVISRELKPLPVNLLHFHALGKASVVLLEWELAKSVSDEHYTVERSADGKTFEPIAELKSNGSSKHSYVDKSPYLGQISYYRLKRQDDKGGLEYSRIEAVNMGVEVFEGLQAVPNPSENGLVYLLLNASVAETYQVVIIDALGREVYKDVLKTDANGIGELVIRDLKQSGVYVARVLGTSKIYQTKMVVK